MHILIQAASKVNMMTLDQEAIPNSTDGLTKQELDILARQEKFVQTGMAYAKEHSTRPGTVGLVLSSSPLSKHLNPGSGRNGSTGLTPSGP